MYVRMTCISMTSIHQNELSLDKIPVSETCAFDRSTAAEASWRNSFVTSNAESDACLLFSESPSAILDLILGVFRLFIVAVTKAELNGNELVARISSMKEAL